MSDATPKGDAIRKAMRWLSEERLADPKAPRAALIQAAGARFDLTPLELQFLYDNWK